MGRVRFADVCRLSEHNQSCQVARFSGIQVRMQVFRLEGLFPVVRLGVHLLQLRMPAFRFEGSFADFPVFRFLWSWCLSGTLTTREQKTNAMI